MVVESSFTIGQIHTTTAEEFLDVLSPRGRYFRRFDPPNPWIFRGHASADYLLVPSALRPQDSLDPLSDWPDRTKNRFQIRAECQMMGEFFTLADNNGLPLPEDSQRLRAFLRILLEQIEARNCFWPPDELLSLLALCQHYGLPTRLLDWSRSALKAAYFAAEGAVRLSKDWKNDDGDLSVWALSIVGIEIKDDLREEVGENPLVFVTAPAAGNANLHAQEGLFLVYRPNKIDLDGSVDRRPLDQIIRQVSKKTMLLHSGHPMLRFTLPISEAAKLLWLLAKEGINGSSMFPGYEGIVKGIREKRYWVNDATVVAPPRWQDRQLKRPGRRGGSSLAHSTRRNPGATTAAPVPADLETFSKSVHGYGVRLGLSEPYPDVVFAKSDSDQFAQWNAAEKCYEVNPNAAAVVGLDRYIALMGWFMLRHYDRFVGGEPSASQNSLWNELRTSLVEFIVSTEQDQPLKLDERAYHMGLFARLRQLAEDPRIELSEVRQLCLKLLEKYDTNWTSETLAEKVMVVSSGLGLAKESVAAIRDIFDSHD